MGFLGMNKLIADALVGIKKEWEAEVESLNKKLFSNPAEDFIAVHKEFKELLDSGVNRFTKEFNQTVTNLATREKKAKRAMSNYCNSAQNDKMATRITHLNSAIDEINNMLYWHNDAEKRRQENFDKIALIKQTTSA